MSYCEQCAALRAEVEKLKALTVKADEAIERQQQDLEEAADRAADCDILRAEVEKLREWNREIALNAREFVAENERLRAVLDDIAYPNPLHNEDDLMRIARAALEEKPNDQA